MYGTSEGDIREVMRCRVVCLASMNVEVSVPVTHPEFQAIQAQNPHGVPRSEKNLVRAIETFDVALDHTGGVGFVVTPATGKKIEFKAKSSAPVGGGSSFNIANVLGEFDIKDVGIIGAVGDDAHGRHIVSTLHKRGFTKLTLFRREATASSLVLREPDGTATILACKPHYHPTPEVLAQLAAACQAEMLIASGVCVQDLPLLQALWGTPSLQTRVFSPHISLVSGSVQDREQCLDLCRRADIVHLNQDEAAHLFGLCNPEGKTAFPEDDAVVEEVMCQRVEPLGTHIFCITRSERGSATYVGGTRKMVVLQPVVKQVDCGNQVGAGDVHLAALAYYLRLRGRPIALRPTLEMASYLTAEKIAANDPRPWAGMPNSDLRTPWRREAEARHRARNSGQYPAAQ